MTPPHPARQAAAATATTPAPPLLAAAPAPPPAAPDIAAASHPDPVLRALQGPSFPRPGALAPGSTPTPPAPDRPSAPAPAPGPSPTDPDQDPTADDAPFGFDTPNRHGRATGALLALIGGYKRFLSPALPPACRFVPSCSEYGYEAVARYGIIRGGRMALWRILRCNPFGRGGVDPVP